MNEDNICIIDKYVSIIHIYLPKGVDITFINMMALTHERLFREKQF